MESGTNVDVFKGIRIIYEDNHILVCIKNEGILSQADDTNDSDMVSLLKEYLKEKYNKPGNVYLGLVHRLDRRVSGLMVFAKTSKAASRLSDSIRNDSVKKTYYAIASGIITGSGTLRNYLKKENEKAIESSDGKEAILSYEALMTFKMDNNSYTVLRVNLQTGRFNQIRAQFSLFGHPLINDFKYGYKSDKCSDEFSHIGLICVGLSFIHPVTKNEMNFTYDEVINRDSDEWIKYFGSEVKTLWKIKEF